MDTCKNIVSLTVTVNFLHQTINLIDKQRQELIIKHDWLGMGKRACCRGGCSSYQRTSEFERRA